MSVAFIPKSLANQIANLPVLGIDACASVGKPVPGYFFYGYFPDRIDPSPDSDNKMTLIIYKTNRLFSHDAVKTLQLNSVENLTVGDVIECQQLLQYQF